MVTKKANVSVLSLEQAIERMRMTCAPERLVDLELRLARHYGLRPVRRSTDGSVKLYNFVDLEMILQWYMDDFGLRPKSPLEEGLDSPIVTKPLSQDFYHPSETKVKKRSFALESSSVSGYGSTSPLAPAPPPKARRGSGRRILRGGTPDLILQYIRSIGGIVECPDGTCVRHIADAIGKTPASVAKGLIMLTKHGLIEPPTVKTKGTTAVMVKGFKVEAVAEAV